MIFSPQSQEWNKPFGPQQKLTPMQLFEFLIDIEVINMIVTFSNTYALQRNLQAGISVTEMKCYIHFEWICGFF